MVRHPDEVKRRFCKSVNLAEVSAVAQDAIDTMDAVLAELSFARARVDKLQAQVQRQAEIITGLEAALKGPKRV